MCHGCSVRYKTKRCKALHNPDRIVKSRHVILGRNATLFIVTNPIRVFDLTHIHTLLHIDIAVGTVRYEK